MALPIIDKRLLIDDNNFELHQGQLLSIDTSGWSIAAKVDYMLIWAEMNGYDFNYRVLKPWQPDPTYYTSIWMYRSDVHLI